MKKRKIGKIVGIILISLVVLLGLVVVIYISDYYHADQNLEGYQTTFEGTIIQESNNLIRIEGMEKSNVGLIYYPGGKVEYIAYLPLLEKISANGIVCFLPKMPANLAVFGMNKADAIIDEHPEITTWYIAGHSLGGAMASSYASDRSDKITGIILMGAYPSSDLSNTSLKMLSIVGTNDEVVNRKNLELAVPYAPENTIYFDLEGGNHGYFGDYGMQEGDGAATITQEEQWSITAQEVVDFIEE